MFNIVFMILFFSLSRFLAADGLQLAYHFHCVNRFSDIFLTATISELLSKHSQALQFKGLQFKEVIVSVSVGININSVTCRTIIDALILSSI